MKKSILALTLSLILVFSMTTTAFAATKASTKTITFGSTTALPSSSEYMPVTVKITNVTSQKTKDFSMYMSDDDVTISGDKSKVIYCKGSTTITLCPNKGEKNAAVYEFCMYFDSKKVAPETVKRTSKYYSFDLNAYEYDFSKKLDKAPDCWGYADGSSMKITKAGTYALFVKKVDDGYPLPEGLTPVFIVVK